MSGSTAQLGPGAASLLRPQVLSRLRAGLGDELVGWIAQSSPAASSRDLDAWQSEQRFCPVPVALRLDTASHIWTLAEQRLGASRAALAFTGERGICDQPPIARLIAEQQLSAALRQACRRLDAMAMAS